MPKLTRYLQKIFANNSNQVGVFGTGVDKETSKNVETLQSADYEDGWSSAIITNKNYPIWQEMDGVQYGLSYQLKYLFQNGIPEWLSTETYYTNNYCSYGGYIYQSLQDDNINHNPALNDGYWTVYSGVSDDRLHALKSYLDEGELLTDAEGLADVKYYAKSSFDLSKFTVVGSPNITDDGIASGFSNGNYITISDTSFLTADAWKIAIPVPKNQTNEAGFFAVANENSLQVGYTASTKRFGFNLSSNGTSWDINAGAFIASAMDASKDALFTMEFTGTQYLFRVYQNGAEVGSSTVNSSTKLFYGLRPLVLGVNRSGTYPTNGSIDLKGVNISVDGIPVFSGNKTGIDTYTIGSSTVTIPYTLSKTGSKIVQSVYRDRVSDMAEQFGYAPYYTLSDTDFTLPQVELYGYIEKRARDIAHPVAQPFFRFSDEINEDEVRLEGAEVDKGLYLAIENDPYLSVLCTAGSTNDKICLPDFRNRVIYGDVASGYIEPELPNITGYFVSSDDTFNHYGGAFYPSGQGGSQSGGSANEPITVFDASRSSSIYKDNGTVKTAGVKARWLCRWK